jgi:ubiquinone/menaquinone biosynthesis C-methylase UbiE
VTRPETIAGAYDATGDGWEHGPGRVYNVLAERVVACSPAPMAGRLVLDLGAGTGAASRAIGAAGGVPVALDGAFGMLAAARLARAVQGDASALPLGDGRVGGVVAAFSLNHVADPVRALREIARVTAPGGPVVVATYAADDSHPVKAAAEAALRAAGWEPEPWYLALRDEIVPRLAARHRCLAAARDAGLDAACEAVRVALPHLGADDLVAWRLGLAQHASFVAGLDPAAIDRVRSDALDRLGPHPPVLVRSILVLTALA